MNKCKYCNNEAEGFNPYNKSYLCGYHAKIKCEQLIKEYNEVDSDTLKDGFFKVDKDDDNDQFLEETVFNVKTGEVIKNYKEH